VAALDGLAADVGHLLDVDAVESDVHLVVLVDLQGLFSFNLCSDPVGLLGIGQGDDLLAKICRALDVQVFIGVGHACVVHAHFHSLVYVVRVLNLVWLRLDSLYWHGLRLDWLWLLELLGRRVLNDTLMRALLP